MKYLLGLDLGLGLLLLASSALAQTHLNPQLKRRC